MVFINNKDWSNDRKHGFWNCRIIKMKLLCLYQTWLIVLILLGMCRTVNMSLSMLIKHWLSKFDSTAFTKFHLFFKKNATKTNPTQLRAKRVIRGYFRIIEIIYYKLHLIQSLNFRLILFNYCWINIDRFWISKREKFAI